eukprot:CAMPEP_0197329292 /NCGR_PEP_ID=MMETSP0892-20130614/5683_1 /TAXON_ID=44058 ORGANISM="Aureoumbra lagunensis, Strain CCMP1510" /NCGR_SAMPLE_ID=MMETSP0892 /ASSEMBLY_ACC=CAM_ASM_000538 /LENGTH=251 /DNA_ID=CAMNT_0042825869 /DNA_START=6 /DNA_END=764 /DNA_ORIENTATION=-
MLFLSVLLAAIVGNSKIVYGLRLWNSGTCPYAQRTWIALEEVGADYEMQKVDLQNKSEEFIAKYSEANPGGRAKVPVLEVEHAMTLTESVPCTEYVFEKFAPASFQSVEQKAQARLAVEIHPFNYFQLLRVRNDPEALADAVSSFGASMQHFNSFLLTCSPEGPYLFGDTFGFADACIAPFAQRCLITLRFFIDIELFEVCTLRNAHRTKAYIEAILDRPSVKATAPDSDVLLESTKTMLLRFDDTKETKR